MTIEVINEDIEGNFETLSEISNSNILEQLSTMNAFGSVESPIHGLKSIGSLVVGTPGNLAADEFVIESGDSDEEDKQYQMADGGDYEF